MTDVTYTIDALIRERDSLASQITRLEEERARLREALEEIGGTSRPRMTTTQAWRRARSALQEGGGDG